LRFVAALLSKKRFMIVGVKDADRFNAGSLFRTWAQLDAS
jgi:hypothetical protein